MSMRYYAFSEIGFVADNNLIQFIKVKFIDELLDDSLLNGDDDIPANHPISEIEDWVFREWMEDKGFSYDGDLEYCRLSPVKEKGVDWPSCEDGYDEVYCYQLNKFPQLFQAAYDSIEDIVKELKQQIGHLLPDNYDIASHIFFIEGVYFG